MNFFLGFLIEYLDNREIFINFIIDLGMLVRIVNFQIDE